MSETDEQGDGGVDDGRGAVSGDATAPPDGDVASGSSGVDSLVAGIRRRLRRARLADGTMLALAGVTGTVTGLFAALLIVLIRFVEQVSFGAEATNLDVLLIPAAGAVAVWAISRLSPTVLGSGVVATMEALVLRGGHFSRRTPFVAVLATASALGTGASGGREAPMVLIGGSLGSMIATRFGLSEEQVRSLVAAGAAAGIGASFNAPIGGMLFAIEVIVGGLRSRSLQVIVLSSVAGSVVARTLVGEGIIYEPSTPYSLEAPWELLLYLALGVVMGAVAVLLIKGERRAFRAFDPVRERFGELGALVLGGFIVGGVALVVPQVLGDGEQLPPVEGVREPIQALIDGEVASGAAALSALALLFAAKYVASLATYGSHSATGTFAPTLFLGATAGAIVATAADLAFPGAGVQVGAYALVGMAAAYGACARAPLAAILIVFELSGDYGLVLPLMLAVGVATFLADRWTAGSVYELPLRERGIVYAEPDDVDLLQTVLVEEVMTTGHPTVTPTMDLPTLRRMFAADRTHGFAVVSGGKLRGVITIEDLAGADALLADGTRPESSITVADLMTADPVTTHATDEVFLALRRMTSVDVGRIPVISDNGTYVGMLRRGDLVDAYGLALSRGVGRQHEGDRAQLRELTGVRFLELTVAEGSTADGSIIAQLDWPTSAIVTTVRRGSQIIVPKGDVELRAGDDVVLLSSHEQAPAVQELFASPTVPRG